MTREEVNSLTLSEIDKTKYLILELITGFGKTKLAIDLVNHICERVFNNDGWPTKVLILVAQTVHKNTWRKEIEKWGGLKTDFITIECYNSLKNYRNQYFDVVVADEVQHLSEQRLEILSTLHIEEVFIGLSATIKKEMRDLFKYKYNATIIKCGLKEAVNDNVLPEPKVYLLPIELDKIKCNYKVSRFGKTFITTQLGYYNNLSSYIDYLKRKSLRNPHNIIKKRLWLSTAGQRLKWLSEQKENIILSLLDKFKNYTTLTFCNNINQSERLGKYNITSKNKKSSENLEMFNNGKIKHITAVNILNEGVNLTNCRIGIFSNLNNSEIIVKQRMGRLLRHKEPIIIIPYFKNTREEELMCKMIEDYNKDNIKIINDVNDIKL